MKIRNRPRPNTAQDDPRRPEGPLAVDDVDRHVGEEPGAHRRQPASQIIGRWAMLISWRNARTSPAAPRQPGKRRRPEDERGSEQGPHDALRRRRTSPPRPWAPACERRTASMYGWTFDVRVIVTMAVPPVRISRAVGPEKRKGPVPTRGRGGGPPPGPPLPASPCATTTPPRPRPRPSASEREHQPRGPVGDRDRGVQTHPVPPAEHDAEVLGEEEGEVERDEADREPDGPPVVAQRPGGQAGGEAHQRGARRRGAPARSPADPRPAAESAPPPGCRSTAAPSPPPPGRRRRRS